MATKTEKVEEVKLTKAQVRGQQYFDLLTRGAKIERIMEVCGVSRQSVTNNVRVYCEITGKVSPIAGRGSKVDAGLAALQAEFA